MTSPADRVIGRLIADRYRVVALVGSGGMGEVYRAEHVGLKRPTALKFMRPAGRAMIALAQGDLAGARAVLAATSPAVDRASLAAAVAMYYDLPRLLHEQEQRRLLALGPDAFDGDRMSWAWALAQT